MDLMEENPINEREKKNSALKVWLIIVIILMILLAVAAGCVWYYAQTLKTNLFKVVIDSVSSSKASNQEGLFIIENGKVYTSISDICSYVGYNFYRGGYRQYTEDRTKCYVNNSREIVTFASGSNEIVKYPADVNELPQNFEIEEEVILKGERLYIDSQGLAKAFNLIVSYDAENNTVSITALPYLTAYYERTYPEISLENSEFGEDVKFNNEKALLNNLIVVKDPSTELYGVSTFDNNNQLIPVISARYSQVEYMEGTDDFIVTTEDKKVGIIGSDGLTKVRPDYDTIDIIDRNVGLYLVSNQNKQSVININGKIIVHPDYDSIGLDVNSYEDQQVTNRYLLLGNCIPVKLNNKWGLIDKDGETILQVQCDEIGCNEVSDKVEKNTSGIVLVPDIQGIVVEIDTVSEDNNKRTKNYGIINAMTGQLMVNTVLDSVYSVTTEEVTRYYMTSRGEVYNIIDWWEQQRKPSNVNETNNEDSTTENTIDNETAETNQVSQ